MKNPFKAQLRAEGLPYRPILGEASAKTVKGEKIGYLTAICYLVPDEKLCPFAKLAGCFDPCLKSAGRGAFNSTQRARAAKTRFFYENQRAFMLSLAADIWSENRRAERLGFQLLVRPNGTSDIPFENIKIDGLTIFQMFPTVQFYDYTKHPGRKLDGKTAGNYDLTYSFSVKGLSNTANQRAAVVFQNRSDIPESFRGWPVVDGDDTDVRHIEPQQVVVALYAKGKARRDKSGFVQIKGRDY